MTAARRTSRATYAVATGMAAWAFTAWLGLHPRPALVVAATVGVFVIGWLADDLVPQQAAFDWAPPHRRRTPRYGRDPTFFRLAQSFSDGTDTNLVAARVHAILLRCIDDRLAVRHGIDRITQPDLARAVLGSAICAYIDAPPRVRRRQIHFYADLLARIEAL